MIHKFTDANFNSAVLSSSAPVLVDFWAPWCGPCHIMEPVVDALAREVRGVAFGKLNVDENPATANAYGIMSIPTFAMFVDGAVAGQVSGTMSGEKMKRWIEGFVSEK